MADEVCSRCRTPYTTGSRFCSGCGRRLGHTPSTAPSEPSTSTDGSRAEVPSSSRRVGRPIPVGADRESLPEFVRARELLGQEFTVTAVQLGESSLGPAYYLDVEREVGGRLRREVIGALASSPIGSQCEKYSHALTVGGTKWTVLERQSKRLKDPTGQPKSVLLLACYELPEVDA